MRNLMCGSDGPDERLQRTRLGKVDTTPSNQELGGQLAACLWICTRAAICNGHKNMDGDKKRNSVVEAVSRDVPDHQWVSEFSALMHEHDVL